MNVLGDLNSHVSLGNVPVSVAEHAVGVRKLKELLGDRLLTADGARTEYSKTTLPSKTKPLAIARPRDHEEVVAVLKLANAFAIETHAISRGKNMGYGDACAANDNALIIDLREMDRIVEINEDLGYAVIQPGVSQGQLAEELRRRDSGLMLDVTGAGPDASIVGNVLQRGFGHTPYGDRTANSCNYVVVDANGDTFRTGFGSVSQSQVGHVYPYGLGPNPQGMVAQSGDYVVTQMTIWLMRRPECIQGFGFKAQTVTQFAAIVDKIGELRRAGVIDSVAHLANDLRVVSSQDWMREYAGHEGPFDEELRAAFRERAGIGRWNGLGGIYGSKAIVKAKRAEISKALRGLTKVQFFGANKIKLLTGIARLLPGSERLRNMSTAVSEVYELLCGRPSASHLQGAFYRNKPASGQVIDTGLIWIAPVIPFRGEDALRLVSSLEPIANRCGFDLPITISPVVPRAAVCITNISFDKTNSKQRTAASACYQEMRKCMDDLGYPPYRTASIN